jgi:hypothetical protein
MQQFPTFFMLAVIAAAFVGIAVVAGVIWLVVAYLASKRDDQPRD